MGKFLLFPLLWWLFGNPFIAIIVLLVIVYFIDRRFIGLTPSLVRPFKRRSQIAKLRQQLLLNPGDVTAKQDVARLYMEKKNYREARKWLESIGDVMEDSAEFWNDLGTAYLHTGDKSRGEEAILKGLSINPRVKYGQPYLRLAALHSTGDTDKALHYLDTFRQLHSSSCEAYYRLGTIYEQLGRSNEAAGAYREAVDIYRSLPKYKKRQERKWVLRCLLKKRQ
ncbi:tetratricopeptide repeat protein [Paenibacillus sp. GCM10012307]|uniref:Tetratricopeptide repeat protein n=1 Tax=Paenibacillus roseus TaxID=2798579 RepID=A0A934J2X7_9BACL|nr:tetratricopeptide repeat protein [Paenibacillus roseus]MBJ6363797.1 tetratricopeptide repeat protein [Paenibacillus roseus]